MRRGAVGCVVLLVITAGYLRSLASDQPLSAASSLVLTQVPSPYAQVEAGDVRALIPDDWHATATASGAREGFFASPQPHAWLRMNGSVDGMSATWGDATRVGVPSDYYYLAATGPVLGRLTSSRTCTGHRRVLVDNRPAWMAGAAGSPGDYVALGSGRCDVHGVPTRWAYFVSAPGYGVERKMGIPASGLYVVVAVLRDSHRAPQLLNTLLDRTRFGGDGIREFVAAARGME